MLNQKLFFFILMLLLNFDAKAFVLAAVPSSLSDTCVEINLKSGTRIVGKITKKTAEKVYFKKCDDLSDTKEYFVAQEKIDSIKTLTAEAKSIQKEKATAYVEREKNDANKAKQIRIWVLFGVSLLSLIVFLLSGFGYFIGCLFAITSIWGFFEALTYKGMFKGKGFVGVFLFIASIPALIIAIGFLIGLIASL